MAKKDEMFMEKVQINYEKINEALKKEGLCARETANLLGYNMRYLYHCKKSGVMPLTAVKQIAELCSVPFETFLAEAKTEDPYDFLDNDDVLAWMPLPEPYKEETNG